MNNENLKILKERIDGDPVSIRFADGEEVSATILSVSETEKDIIYRPLSVNHNPPEKKGTFRATFGEIDSIS